MSTIVPTSIPSDQMKGAIVVNVFAILSTFALASVVVRVIWLATRRLVSSSDTEPQEYVFFNTQLGRYAVCLLIGNMFNGVAGLIGVRWLVEGVITQGGLCTSQAILMQLGNWSTGYFTVTIAVHTFNSLVLRRRQSALICGSAITVGWITAAMLAAGPFIEPRLYRFGPAYGADGLSCGIRSVYLKAQFFFHLFPIFVASVLSAILYSIIFLVLRGTLNIRGGVRLTLDPNERWVTGGVTENYHRFVARIARSMLWYPIAYIALLLPYSIVRLLAISGFTVAFESLIFASVCWYLLGAVNVMLLYNTFRVLGPAFEGTRATRGDESFGVNEHLNRHSPSRLSEKRLSFNDKVMNYRYPTPPFQPGPLDYPYSSPKPPTNSLHSTDRQQTTSAQSFYSYPSSPSIGRSITPSAELNRMIASPEPSLHRSSVSTTQTLNHFRLGSTDSLGLPAPPRRTRSPVVHHPATQPTLERTLLQVRMVDGRWTPMDPQISRQASNQTFGRPNSITSATSVELGSPGWHSRDGSNGGYKKTIGSAVNPIFPISNPASPPSSPRVLSNPPRHSRSLSAVPMMSPASTNHQRAFRESLGGATVFGHTRASSSQAQVYYP
ncbi:hypothetical protein BDZ94DRAFT_1306142 [Collybia nuda]|uniref:G-protein coupled receptors family 1 profile domain-containing protein n=1 Tax=Collybia nuda TaxID=64659 RepID=A0A9P5YEV3_9AGAR|nr:hypothetical protein BDZ94DRAFT_1306142 [Collybia nuda]